MDGLYIILIIKACRIRIEPCRLDDTFEKQKLFIFERTIGEILGKVLPIDPQANPIWRRSRLDLLLSNTIFVNVGNSRPVDIFYYFRRRKFSVCDISTCFW